MTFALSCLYLGFAGIVFYLTLCSILGHFLALSSDEQGGLTQDTHDPFIDLCDEGGQVEWSAPAQEKEGKEGA